MSDQDVDLYWLQQAVELSKLCPPSDTTFAVGAIIVGANGEQLATGRAVWGCDHEFCRCRPIQHQARS